MGQRWENFLGSVIPSNAELMDYVAFDAPGVFEPFEIPQSGEVRGMCAQEIEMRLCIRPGDHKLQSYRLVVRSRENEQREIRTAQRNRKFLFKLPRAAVTERP